MAIAGYENLLESTKYVAMVNRQMIEATIAAIPQKTLTIPMVSLSKNIP